MRLQKSFFLILIVFSIFSCENPVGDNPKNQQNSKELPNDSAAKKKVTETTQKIKTDLEENGLKGQVKVLKQEEFYSSNDSVIGYKTGSNSFSYKFNIEGYKIEEQNYDSIGMIKSQSEYDFSPKGEKTAKRTKDLDEKLLNNYTYEYDQLGLLAKINISDYEKNDNYSYYQTFGYDKNGNEIKSTLKTLSNTKVQSSESVYNDKNQKIKLSLFDNMDTPYAICEYSCNENGDVSNEKYYTGNNILFSEYSNTYVYDTKKNWIKKTYSLIKKHVSTVENKDKPIGIETVTFRTLTYY